jgi:hypothetical protein
MTLDAVAFKSACMSSAEAGQDIGVEPFEALVHVRKREAIFASKLGGCER